MLFEEIVDGRMDLWTTDKHDKYRYFVLRRAKNLDPSYKMALDFETALKRKRKKKRTYNLRNMV